MDESEIWRAGPASELRPSDIHVWRVELNPPPALEQRYRMILAEDELVRAGRFHFERDRRRFTTARGALRVILSQYLESNPGQIKFLYEPAGKPYLPGAQNKPDLRFNVSHSGELALIGVCLGQSLGIDIEFKDADHATLEVARRFFAPEEIAAVEAAPAESRGEVFFAIWTMKEAYIKARGEGVALGLATFAVAAGPARNARLLRSSHGVDETKRWKFWTIDAGPAYAAALAAEGDGEQRLSFWTPDSAR